MQNRVQNATGSNRTVRLLALGGVAGPLLFVPIVVAGGLLYDGYSHAGQAISELGGEGAEYAALQNFNFIMIGVLVLGFSWALARVLGGPPLGPGLVGFSVCRARSPTASCHATSVATAKRRWACCTISAASAGSWQRSRGCSCSRAAGGVIRGGDPTPHSLAALRSSPSWASQASWRPGRRERNPSTASLSASSRRHS